MENQNKKLTGKIAIVTGGARGIGKAIVTKFLSEGANVMACDIQVNTLLSLEKELFQFSDNLITDKTDVTLQADIENTIKKVINKWGRVDILVNNAGVNAPKSIEEISEKEWDWVLSVNLKGPFLFTKSVISHMKTGGGVIINMVSPAGKTGGAKVRSAHYNCSKGGLVTLTKSAARELACYNIRVNGISPGTIATEMILSMDPGVQKELLSLIPLNRIGTPEDVAKTAAFLSSDEADYITGQIIPVNGGMWMMY